MYGMITHHDHGYRSLSNLTWHENKEEYAAIHGYGIYARTEDFTTQQPNGLMTGFEKIYIALDVLEENPEFKWLWWTGTDSMITNFSIRIEDKIDDNYHIIVSVDYNGINADSILIRNSKESKDFLKKVISLEKECSSFWDAEQRAICKLLGFPGTTEPGWLTGSNLKIENQYKNVVKLVPQRYMNSYNYNIYHYKEHNDKFLNDGNWQFGDWLIHWPGCSLDLRLKLYHYYQNQIKR